MRRPQMPINNEQPDPRERATMTDKQRENAIEDIAEGLAELYSRSKRDMLCMDEYRA